MNIFDMAIEISVRQKYFTWDTIINNAIIIRKFMDRYPAVTHYSLTGEGSWRVKKLYERMVR